nr:probable tRNA (uracil-O(2)-)-methyltransferase isoform X1 [Parasteatoda tepidariorum]
MDEQWKVINEFECVESISTDDFWNGVSVYIERPHLLNRRLLAAQLLETKTAMHNHFNEDLNGTLLRLFNEEILNMATLHDLLKSIPSTYIKSNEPIKKTISATDDNGSKMLFVRNLLSRNMKLYEDMVEVSVADKSSCSVAFYPVKTPDTLYPLSPAFPYRILLNNNKLMLEVSRNSCDQNNANNCKSEKWLASDILPKIYKWCKFHPEETVLPSLNLVSAKLYNENLHKLKDKYGKHYVKIWPDYNSTDPFKYVYEDISICAYLITLWEEERIRNGSEKKQTFLDLGCGNGLLVDILSSEGYDGLGIDLRRRKIWDAFESRNKLFEMTVDPNQHFLEYDWIIGNHPDELTPWIPVIAARSSYSMKIFLMPCCYYTFNGKYAHCDAGLSRYQSYLKFIHNICEISGFVVQKDKLRIPSTKRSCFVCTARSYEMEEEAAVDLQRTQLINSELKFNEKLNKKSSEQLLYKRLKTSVGSDFKHREQVERIQNCTNLDKNVINNIVFEVIKILLSTEDYILINREEELISWNSGGAVKLEDLVKLLKPDMLSSLKNQNGGFQTLLRNHRNVFEIKNCCVQLRVPEKYQTLKFSQQKPDFKQKKNKDVFKSKNCFFHFYHPQGCPLSSKDCSFSHEKID